MMAILPQVQKTWAALTLLAVALLGFAVTSTSASSALGNSLTIVKAEEPGVRLTINGIVVDWRGHPIANARLHVYQTDASGRYTPERPMDEPHARLSGWLITDARGAFVIHTIRPGGYPKAVHLGDRDRHIPAHIHIDATAAGYRLRKMQAVFADDPLLGDAYWKEWVARLHQPVLEVHSNHDGAVAALRIVLKGQ
jgi:protocatechuate 3,4-dioxygenase beta subunit